jgi:predicted XRE-type DNA-binding protein
VHTDRVDQELQRQLARELCAIMQGWPQALAASLLGIHPPDVSALRRGRHGVFSVARLIRLIARQGYHVEVRLEQMPRRFPDLGSPRPLPTISVVRIDRFGRTLTPVKD